MSSASDDLRAMAEALSDAPPSTTAMPSSSSVVVGGRGSYFPPVVVELAVQLVRSAKVPLSSTVKILSVVSEVLRLGWDVPHWTSVRNWVMRCGLARWQDGLQPADDWQFLADHCVQMGTAKAFVTTGIRLGDYQKLGRALRAEDLTLLRLELMGQSTKEAVLRSYEETVRKVGVPLAVANDNGADVAAGARLLKKKHNQVRTILDCKHKAACLLKKRLQNNERWTEFQKQLATSKTQLQQTELAFLTPPSQRSKARYMNVEHLLRWGEKVEALLEGRLDLGSGVEVKAERLEQKLGWLRGFEEEMAQWREWLKTIDVVVGYVGKCGLSRTTEEQTREKMGRTRSETELGQELLTFIREQTKDLKEGETVVGSTEAVETIMGILKRLQGENNKGGFTGLLLGLGLMVGKKSKESASQLLAQISMKDVRTWIKTKVGITVQSLRSRLTLAFEKTQQKPLHHYLPLT